MIPDDWGAKKFLEADIPGLTLRKPFAGILLVDSDGNCRGAVALNNFDGVDCHLTVSGRGALTPDVLARLAHYVFEQMGCARCTAITREENIAALRALRKGGWTYEGLMRGKFADGSNGVVYGILKADATRWIRRIKHG